MSTSHFNRAGGAGSLLSMLMAACMLFSSSGVFALAPAASGGAATTMTPEQLDNLVAPIALYPDDLIGIVLPAATYPIQIVQAERFLGKRKTDKNLPVDETWHDAVKSLLNYPEVVTKMSAELDWTTELGEAVVTDQGAVLEAIQRFRLRTQAAGNLKSDKKQVVVVEKEVIRITQADPQVIYVPQYDPATVVVYGGYSSWGYYPAPYPVYYYPYPPGAAFATGLIWGAAISHAWDGGRYVTHYGGVGHNNINIDRNTNINIRDVNRVSARPAQSTAWKPDKQPGQVRGTATRTTTTARVGDLQGGTGLSSRAPQAVTRPATQAAARPSAQPAARPASVPSARTVSRESLAASQGGGALGGYGSGREARADSTRGAASREAQHASRVQSSPQGGSSRAAAGGGGRAAAGGSGGGRATAGGGGGRSSGSGGGRGGRGR